MYTKLKNWAWFWISTDTEVAPMMPNADILV